MRVHGDESKADDLTWTPELIGSLSADLKKPRLLNSSFFKPNVLVDPIPDVVQRYLDGDKAVNFNRHVSHLSARVYCGSCGTTATTKWLSKSRFSMTPSKNPFEATSCQKCQAVAVEKLKASTYEKWHPRLLDMESALLAKGPTALTAPERLDLAKRLFGGKKDFYKDYVWEVGNLEAISSLLLEELVVLRLDKDLQLRIYFRELEVAELSTSEYREMFVDWAMNFIVAHGNEIDKYGFSFSLKYGEEVRSLVEKSSYYALSYALSRARKEAEAYWGMERRRKDNTFKHGLRSTLENVLNGTWKVPQGSGYHARRDCPDSFWSLIRLEEHDLSEEEIFSLPLGDIAEFIRAYGHEDDKVIH